MNLYYCLVLFIIGVFLGSLYNIIGYRLPKKEVILYPSINHPDCNKISLIGLLPVINYFILKIKYKKNISLLNPAIELLSGLLFLVSYLYFGFTIQCLLSITFISMLLIIIVSDYNYMIICDEVLIVFLLLILIELYFIGGLGYVLKCLLNGLVSFLIMFLIKKLGDFLFKRESMGGGDIKLLFIFGLMFGIPMAFFSIFLSAIIALPISLVLLKSNSNHEIPFGPFLSISAIILLFYGNDIVRFLISILY